MFIRGPPCNAYKYSKYIDQELGYPPLLSKVPTIFPISFRCRFKYVSLNI